MKTAISFILSFVVISLIAQPELKDRTDSLNYFLGLSLGYSLKTAPFAPDAALVASGLAASLEDRTQHDQETCKEIFQKLNEDLSRELSEEFAESGDGEGMQKSDVDPGENLEKGNSFLEENGRRTEVTTTESGLQFEPITITDGPNPTATSTVRVHYEGTLIDGTVFDSSYDRGEPISFPLNRVISGWTEGVQLMAVGSVYKFYIPSELAYGPREAGMIPSNSVLIFKIELLGIE